MTFSNFKIEIFQQMVFVQNLCIVKKTKSNGNQHRYRVKYIKS